MSKVLTVDEWVRRLNKLAAEMHSVENGTHPSAWSEMNADLMAEWLEVAKRPIHDPAIQMELGL